jgi:hypothetical protein
MIEARAFVSIVEGAQARVPVPLKAESKRQGGQEWLCYQKSNRLGAAINTQAEAYATKGGSYTRAGRPYWAVWALGCVGLDSAAHDWAKQKIGQATRQAV